MRKNGGYLDVAVEFDDAEDVFRVQLVQNGCHGFFGLLQSDARHGPAGVQDEDHVFG